MKGQVLINNGNDKQGRGLHVAKHIQPGTQGIQSWMSNQGNAEQWWSYWCNQRCNTVSAPALPTLNGAGKVECVHSKLRRERQALKSWRDQGDWKKRGTGSSVFMHCKQSTQHSSSSRDKDTALFRQLTVRCFKLDLLLKMFIFALRMVWWRHWRSKVSVSHWTHEWM